MCCNTLAALFTQHNSCELLSMGLCEEYSVCILSIQFGDTENLNSNAITDIISVMLENT